MIVCIEKSTGKLIEMQSFAIKGTLILNAVNAGYMKSEIEEKEITETELQSIINSSKNYADRRREEYPPITDYIDGIIKGDAKQVQNYIDSCLSIKAKYPK